MTEDLLDKWLQNLEITPEEARNQDIESKELRQAVNGWSDATKIRWLYEFLPRRRDTSKGMYNDDRLTYCISRTVALVKAMDSYKEQLGYKD
jgi:hypothetical protein